MARSGMTIVIPLRFYCEKELLHRQQFDVEH